MQWDLKSPEEKHGVSTKHCIILSHWVNTVFPLLHLFTLGRHELKNLFGAGQIMQVHTFIVGKVFCQVMQK